MPASTKHAINLNKLAALVGDNDEDLDLDLLAKVKESKDFAAEPYPFHSLIHYFASWRQKLVRSAYCFGAKYEIIWMRHEGFINQNWHSKLHQFLLTKGSK